MTKNRKRSTSHLTRSLLGVVVIAVMPVMMMGYPQRQAKEADLERSTSTTSVSTVLAKETDVGEQPTTIVEQMTPQLQSDAMRPDLQIQIAMARQLAAESELAIREGGGGSLSLGALLAIESVKRRPTAEGDRALRNVLSIMSRLEFRITKSGNIKHMVFDPGGRWIAASYNKSARVWDLATGEEIALLGHDNSVRGVAFDPTGNLIATTASDATARLWKTDTWEQITQLEHDANEVNGVTFDPEGLRLATSSGKMVTIWDVSTGKEIVQLEHMNPIRDIAFSPYGKWIATSEIEGSIIWVWDVETGEEVAQLIHDSHIKAMVFSPYGKWLATASGNTAQVWEVNTGRQVVRVIHRDIVHDVAFSPDTMLLATGSQDKTARIWEIATGRELVQLNHEGEVVSIDFSPDGTSLATGSGYALSESPARIWDVATGREIARMEHPKQVENVIFSPDGSRLATQHWSGNVLYIWDVTPSGPEMLNLRRENSVTTVRFGEDENILVSGDYDGSLQVWDTTTWQEITPAPMRHTSEIRAIALSPDSSRLASTALDGTTIVWDFATGEELIRVKHDSWTTDVAFSPDGSLLATSSADRTARLWDIATGLEIARATHSNTVRDLNFSPDGQRLASAGGGGVRVLQAPEWKEIALLRHPQANDIAFSPDGLLLTSVGGDDIARVWDTSSWQEVVQMKHNDQDGVVTAVAFSPDGQKLATGSDSTMTRVWDTETWEEIARIPFGADSLLFSATGRWLFTRQDYGKTVQIWDTSTSGDEVANIKYELDIRDMALNPDGQLVATAHGSLGDDGELLVTTWRPDDLIADACSRLGRNLTLNEWQQYIGDEPYSQTCSQLPVPLSSFEDAVNRIEERLCMDDPNVTASRYEVAASLALLSNDEFPIYQVCRYGTQEGFAAIVLPVCEHAVELTPNKASLLDSRGLARALTGDYRGALEDIKSVVEAWEDEQRYAELITQRKQIIEAMENGRDVTPYIEGCREFAAVTPTPGLELPTPTLTPTPAATPTQPLEVELQPTEVIRSFVTNVDRVVKGRPGETVTHTLTVTNTGNITGSYDIWAKTTTYREFSLPGLGYGSDTFDYRGSVGVVGSGNSIKMPIKVSIPSYATANEFEQTSLLVNSVSMQLVTAVSYTTSIERMGHVGLDARDVFVRDDYAYVAAGIEGLRILDVSDVLVPVEVGSYNTGEGALGQIEQVEVVGDYAYLVTNLSGIRIVDVSDPAAPVEVGAYTPGGSVQALKLAGDYAYVVWDSCIHRCTDKLRIVNISDPTSPVEVSTYGRTFESGGYETGDRINDVAVLGNHAFLFLPDEMRVLHVSNPADPVEVDTYEKTGDAVVVWGDYAYIQDDKQIRVADISNSKLVVEVGSYNVPDSITNMSQSGGFLYVTTEQDVVYILDLVIPSAPTLVGSYNALGNREIGGVAAKGGYVYLAAGPAGLQIVDIADLAAPQKAGVYGAPASVMGVTLTENYAYAADRYNGLRVLDLTGGPSSLVEVGFFDEPDTGALDVAVKGDFAYVILGICEQQRYNLACYGDLHVLDISTPTAPVEVGIYEGEWHRVEVSGNHAFIVGGSTVSGDKPLHILDLSNPFTPQLVASYEASDFALANGYLYLLSDKQERMTIFDAATLDEVGSYDMPEHHQSLYFTREIAVSGDYAYILENYSYTTGSGASWHVVNISDPTSPTGMKAAFNHRSTHESWGEPAAAVYDGAIFLAAKSSGLRVLDVTDAASPTEVDSFGALRDIMDVAIDAAGYIYVASDLSGLYVLRYAVDGVK